MGTIQEHQVDLPALKEQHYSGATLLARGLYDSGIRLGFGIPGTHNIELYDALSELKSFRSVLVTDEQSAGFMADGAYRASGEVACLNLVPGAGATHALSGIAEAYFDQIPMLVVMCAPRTDLHYGYQLHDIDQGKLVEPVTKKVFHVTTHQELYNVVRHAVSLSKTAPCAPVAVIVPAELLFKTGPYTPKDRYPLPIVNERLGPSEQEYSEALTLMRQARRISLYVGLGAEGAPLVKAAEALKARVFTTISGKGVFPELHPQFVWNGMGEALPPSLKTFDKEADLALVVGARLSEVATASYGFELPDTVIHVDIDRTVLGRNFATTVGIVADATAFLSRLTYDLAQDPLTQAELPDLNRLKAAHAQTKNTLATDAEGDGVNLDRLFSELQESFGPDTVFVTDSGNGLFKAMESLKLNKPRSFLAPVDFSCMGYAVPAAIGAKLAAPTRPVVACVGDGAILMTGLEMLTASHLNLPVVFLVLNDGKLGQIAQFQQGALGEEQLTTLSGVNFEALAKALHLSYVTIESHTDLPSKLREIRAITEAGKPVLVDVSVNYSTPSFFTKGVLKTNFHRLAWSDRLRMGARLLKRKVFS